MTCRTRTKCLEVPTNEVEHDTIKDFARHIGMAAAVFARFAMFQYIETHDARELAQTESRNRRDAPVVSRASGKRGTGLPTVRHRDSARSGFGGTFRPIRV